ncbi:unnamed protein product, partial [Ilex paraguariensis]
VRLIKDKPEIDADETHPLWASFYKAMWSWGWAAIHLGFMTSPLSPKVLVD